MNGDDSEGWCPLHGRSGALEGKADSLHPEPAGGFLRPDPHPSIFSRRSPWSIIASTLDLGIPRLSTSASMMDAGTIADGRREGSRVTPAAACSSVRTIPPSSPPWPPELGR